MPKILQVNYKYSGSWQDLERQFRSAVQDIADVPGLRWKVWLVDEARNAAGGIHLFDDAASVQAYLEGPLVAGLRGDPALLDIEAKVFDVEEGLSAGTRAPLLQAVVVPPAV